MRHTLPTLLGAMLVSVSLAACGGGGGGSSSGTTTAPIPSSGSSGPGAQKTGSVLVRVVDESGNPVPGAYAAASVGSLSQQSGTTDANGQVVLAGVLSGEATIAASAFGFYNSGKTTVSVATNGTTRVDVKLRRRYAATVAVLGTRPVQLSSDGKRLEFEADLAVLDPDGRPIENLTASAFELPGGVECWWAYACVNDAGGNVIASWRPVNVMPDAFTLVPQTTRRPFAAGLLVDQGELPVEQEPWRSESIARFLESVTGGDAVALAEFQGLPPTPVLQLHGGFVSDGRSLVPVAEGLPNRVGGSSPGELAVPQMLEFMTGQAPAQPASLVLVGNGWTRGLSLYPSGTTRALAAASRAARIPITTLSFSDTAADLSARTGGVSIRVEFPAQYRGALLGLGSILSGEIAHYRMRFSVEFDKATAAQPGNTLYAAVRVQIGPNPEDHFYAMMVLPF